MSNSLIDRAFQYAVSQCNSPSVGYSQTYRCEQTVDGVTYYDCASFIWYALKHAGFDIEKEHGSSYPFVVHTMHNTLIKLGFKQVPIKSPWKSGDILTRPGHTEMVYSGRRTMGAHTNGRPLQQQVSINTYESTTSMWSNCYRYQGGARGDYSTLEWIKGNRYLSESESLNNAMIVYSFLSSKGWSKEAICGVLGNMQRESGINPALWQSMDYGNYGVGYGLVQWTPATNYTNWANSKGYDITDGTHQLEWINERSESSGQWIATRTYDYSFDDFKVSTESPEELCKAFLRNFERAGVEALDERIEWANYYYRVVDEALPFPEGDNPWGYTKDKKKGYNFVLFKKRKGI